MRLREQIEAVLPTEEAAAMSHKQIAAKLGLPETVGNLQDISRACNTLRKFKAAAFKEHHVPRSQPHRLWWRVP